MGNEVIDTNVLMVATAMEEDWRQPRIPTSDTNVIRRVFDWVRSFRQDPERHLVMDAPLRTILAEYSTPRNLPRRELYGRRVVQHKFDTGAMHFVELEYWYNGTEAVACLPPEAKDLLHDLGDHKMVAAAFCANAPIVNATDSDWTEPGPARALEQLDIGLVQLLDDQERAACKTGKVT